jgi:hypothetical protein
MDEITQNCLLWPVVRIEKRCICRIETKRKIIFTLGRDLSEKDKIFMEG